MAWITPIFDRTPADVVYAKLHRDSPPNLRGALNYSDWNRITGNLHYLADLLGQYGYQVRLECKTNWSRNDMPAEAQVTTIRNDIMRLQKGFLAFTCPLLSWNTHIKINAIESFLFHMKAIIDRMLQTFPRAGNMVYGGSTLYMITGG